MLSQQRPALHFTGHPGKGGPPDPGSHSAQQVGYVSMQLPPPEEGGSASHRPTCQAGEQQDLHRPASSRAVQVLAGQVTASLPAANVTCGAPAALWAPCSALSPDPHNSPYRKRKRPELSLHLGRTQPEGSRLQARDRTEPSQAGTLILDLQTCEK